MIGRKEERIKVRKGGERDLGTPTVGRELS
jgi:hypothetical protein